MLTNTFEMNSDYLIFWPLGIGAAAFLGYCVYFDNKRRSAPDFRAKLKEKRRLAAKRANANKGKF